MQKLRSLLRVQAHPDSYRTEVVSIRLQREFINLRENIHTHVLCSHTFTPSVRFA